MNLKPAKARLALIEQEAEILRDYISRMESLGEQANGQPFSALSTRARNAIRFAVQDDNPTVEQVATLDLADLGRQFNVGKRTIREIETWLLSHGFTWGTP